MPSAKVLSEKKKIVEDLTEKLKSNSGVFIDYSGISAIEDTELRVKMREASIDYSVVKNTMMKFAIKNVGFDELDSIFHNTTSMAISTDDPIAPARIAKEYSEKFQNYFEIKAGFMDGKVLSVDEVKAIASIPPLPILQAQFLGTLLAPITSLAIVLKAIAEKDGAVVEATPSEPVAEAAPAAEVDAAPSEEAAPAEAVAEAEVAVEAEAPADAAEEPTTTEPEAEKTDSE